MHKQRREINTVRSYYVLKKEAMRLTELNRILLILHLNSDLHIY